jgi:NAD(P)-dependent dehydrogenase (short-subunit alcohol dehydrogenase family)
MCHSNTQTTYILYSAPMSNGVSKAVLISGCSSGIGEATARRLAGHGWTVYASARRPESIEHLADAGCKLLQLDVTDEQSMRAAVETVEREHGAVGVLVNNAGYGQAGAIEQVPLEAVRRQFETNVFGGLTLTQMVLAGMREQRWGKIVNVGSICGRVSFPGGGLYSATKYALEAISDALRFVVRGFGVDVVLLEPGLIITNFTKNIAVNIDEMNGAGPYGDFNAKLSAMMANPATESPLRYLGGGPDVVAKAIEKAITRRRSPSRILLTPSAFLTLFQRKLLPDRLWDAMMRGSWPQPR